MRFRKSNQGGFTLIELLVVIGILAILLAITLIAINPNKHFQSSRNAQRSSNVSSILDAIYEYESGHNGNVPPSLSDVSTTAEPLAKTASVTASATSFSTPNLTFTVPSGNAITSGTVTVTGCDQSGDNGTFSVTSGTDTTIVVTNASGSNTSATGCSIGSWTGTANLCADVVPDYLADLPMDPSASAPTGGSTPCAVGVTAYDTGYTIAQSAGNRFTVAAPDAEGGETISVSR